MGDGGAKEVFEPIVQSQVTRNECDQKKFPSHTLASGDTSVSVVDEYYNVNATGDCVDLVSEVSYDTVPSSKASYDNYSPDNSLALSTRK